MSNCSPKRSPTNPQVTAGLVIPGTMITGSRPARSPP
ncbi:Uncharacterised protein [Bordetella pertussis]|nr:Uncharacterised protein [Bordetella pertussis]CFP57924.1 Uncharacterised protein [Bordetella pertussis]CFW41685.1 Uncharacterised protein [Bordetella pertussis]